MPEGFSSVADFRVVFDANTEKFHSGLEGVRGFLRSFQSEGSQSLGGLDNVLGMVGSTALGVSGKVKMFAAAVEAGIGIYKQFASEGRAVAEQLGATAEYDRLTASLDDLGLSIQDGVVQGFFALQGAAVATSGDMLGFAAATHQADTSSKGFAATLLDKVADAIDTVRAKLRLYALDSATSAKEVNETLGLIDKEIAKSQERLARLSSGDPTLWQKTLGFFGKDALAEEMSHLKAWQAARDEAIKKAGQLPKFDWVDPESVKSFTSSIDAQVEALEKQAATLGMSTRAAAEFKAYQDALNDAVAKGVTLSEDQLSYYRQRAAEIGRLTEAIANHRKVEQEAARAEQEAQQRDRRRQSLFDGFEREIDLLRRRAAAMEIGADAAEQLAFEERVLQSLRQNGTFDEGDVVRARAIIEARRQQAELTARMRDELAELGQVGQTVSQALGNAFSQWTRGAELDVETMVANMLAQLAQLTFQMSVLEPRFGGGRDGGTGAVGSLLGSVFGGFRAAGGPVEAGRAYIVGEKRPELFIPNAAGRIEPSVGGGQPVQIVTQIDARGATADAIQELKQMMAVRDAALPNQVLAVVREGRDRGLA